MLFYNACARARARVCVCVCVCVCGRRVPACQRIILHFLQGSSHIQGVPGLIRHYKKPCDNGGTGQCTDFGLWMSQRNWRTGCELGFYLHGTSAWQGQLYFRDAERKTQSNMLVAALVTRSWHTVWTFHQTKTVHWTILYISTSTNISCWFCAVSPSTSPQQRCHKCILIWLIWCWYG